MAHSWAEGGHSIYQSKIRFLHRFEHTFGVTILSRASLARPPVSDEIPLTWAQLSYSLHPGCRCTPKGTRLTLSYGTIHQLRSAASQYMAWDIIVRYPGHVYMDQSKRVIHQACRPIDSLGTTMVASGMKAHLGDEYSRPWPFWPDMSVGWTPIWISGIGQRERLTSGLSWRKLVWLISLCGLNGFGRVRRSVFNDLRWFRLISQMVRRWICSAVLVYDSVLYRPRD